MSHPVGFFSYVRFNDEIEENRITEFRERLEKEVSMLFGDPFELFQDTKDVGFGQNPQRLLDEGVAHSALFIPVLTPAYLKRPACRDELEKFLAREKKLGRDDLVLPIMYIETPAITDEARRNQDQLAIAIHAHQYRDWSDLRFEPWDKSKFTRLTAIAKEIVKALERGSILGATRPAPRKKASRPSRRKTKAESEGAMPSAAKISAPNKQKEGTKSKRIEPPTLVVDPMPGRGDFTSIGAAIAAAKGGERILVHPHLYSEALSLDKPVEVIGDGKREEIVVEAAGASVISFQASFGRVSNLTIRQNGGGNGFGVNIPQGQLIVEDCDITSRSLSCIAVSGGANPIIRRNVIHEAKESGILVFNDARGTIEDNDIFRNALSGLDISGNADPVLRRNRIHDGKTAGILVYENAKGLFEDNDIFSNAMSGIDVQTNADPVVRRNRIHDGQSSGVLVGDEAKGIFEDNEIFSNALSGVQIIEGADPVLRRNRIYGGKEGGVLADSGKGTLEDNDIFGNTFTGVEIRNGGSPTLRQNRVTKNQLQGIWIKDGGGIFQNNDLRGNKMGAWRIDDEAKDVKRENNNEG